MRRLCVCAAIAVLLLFLVGAVATAGSDDSSSLGVEQGLSSKPIRERFDEINSKYEIGQPFTEEDAKFVKTHATPEAENGVKTLTTRSFNKAGSGSGVSAGFYGTVWHNKGTINHSYGGNITATILSGYPNWTNTDLHITRCAYGLVGTGGFGLVYSGSIDSPTAKTSPYSMNQSRQYTCLVYVYSYTNAYCTIYTSSSSFNIYAF